jgi:hypothetical protein
MNEQDIGKVAIIMAWGKSISMVIGSFSGLATFIILIKLIL